MDYLNDKIKPHLDFPYGSKVSRFERDLFGNVIVYEVKFGKYADLVLKQVLDEVGPLDDKKIIKIPGILFKDKGKERVLQQAPELGALFDIPEFFDLITAIDLSNDWSSYSDERFQMIDELIGKVYDKEAKVIYSNDASGNTFSEPVVYYCNDEDIPDYVWNGLIDGELVISIPNKLRLVEENKFGLTNDDIELFDRLVGGVRISCKEHPHPINCNIINDYDLQTI